MDSITQLNATAVVLEVLTRLNHSAIILLNRILIYELGDGLFRKLPLLEKQ